MHDTRVNELRTKLNSNNIDSLLISNFHNILYLTGFKTLTTDEREAFVLLTKKNIYLFSDERYLTKNSQFPIPNFQSRLIEPQRGLITHLQEITKEENIKTLGFESEDIRYFEFDSLKQRLFPIQLVPTHKLIIGIRELKQEEEVKRIREACKIADQCLEEIAKTIQVGMSEKEVAFRIEFWLKEKGYDLAFDPIVAVDANSSLPHYNTKTGRGIIKKGSVIMIDFGAKYEDYLSDITRMFFYGKPQAATTNIYNILLNAQEKTLGKLSFVKYLKEADEYCRRLITSEKLSSYPHSTGHGVGLEIHEYPKVSFNSLDIKKAGQVFTVEPGVYFQAKWGMRIEDTIVITEDLKVEALTKYPKSLQIIE